MTRWTFEEVQDLYARAEKAEARVRELEVRATVQENLAPLAEIAAKIEAQLRLIDETARRLGVTLPAEAPLCNLCGLSCRLGDRENGGLLNVEVRGGYESPPGNGYGALDDGTTYTFSLCEFCLDWIFSQSAIPPEVNDNDGKERFRPAMLRVLGRSRPQQTLDAIDERARVRDAAAKQAMARHKQQIENIEKP